MNETATALPHAISERWQPLRIGMVDLFYYDDEQFWFHDGRLLLRGNNGTGKSKVLALSFPFLLDGSIAARRVEPDADPKKRMEWNLLLDGAHRASERSGYAWAEFGRRDDDGTEHFTTLAIGLKAAAGRGIVKTWYAVTTRRVGDLRLIDEGRTVLSQERLRDELAATGSGHVFTSQEAYRRAVDEALFRLGEERYTALVDLLIQLRQPQLSKKPDEKALSRALTEALAPLDQAVVADVAESFRSLEDERAGITDARDTLGAAEEFLRHYRSYARVASRRRTTAVRLVNSAYEHAGRDLRAAQDQLQVATEEVERLRGRRNELETARSALEGQERALQASPEMRDAARLSEADREASTLEGLAARAAADAERAAREADAEAQSHRRAAHDHEELAAESRQHERAAAQLAGAAGLTGLHERIVADAAAAGRELPRRREQIAHVRALVQHAEQATRQAEAHRRSLDSAQSEAATRADALRTARAVVRDTVETYRDEVRRYASALTAIDLGLGVDEVIGQAEAWAQSMIGESPARTAVETAVTAAQAKINAERALAELHEAQVTEQLALVRGQIEELEAGGDPEPPAGPARDAASRPGREGAPLWRLTDFAGGVDAGVRAGLEAALHSAGLLDAWVFPDGTVQAEDDVVLAPLGASAQPSLADVLVAAPGPGASVEPEAVRAVLTRIGWGADAGVDVWVDGTGQWGAGPARGSWHKDQAEFIGAGAREAHRRALLATLSAQEDELRGALAAARDHVAEADRHAGRVSSEKAGYPGEIERALGTAHSHCATAENEVERAERREAEAQDIWERAAHEAEEARAELTQDAELVGVGTTVRQIDEALAAVAAYELALVTAREARRAATRSAHDLERALERAAQAAQAAQDRDATRVELHRRAAGLRARYEELHATVGATVAELQVRLRELGQRQATMAEDLSQNSAEQLTAVGKRERLDGQVGDLERRREESSALRDAQIATLRTFVETGLLRVALPDLEVLDAAVDDEWHVTSALGLSRRAEQELGDVDESDLSWNRVQQRLSTASQELLTQMSRHGHTAFLEQRDDVLVARVRYQHEEVDVDVLAHRLAGDVAERERLLSAREREILENHLINEVAGHLHELLGTAEEQIEGINRELAERKTSTGMQLRVRWRERADGPTGLADARRLMSRSDATWTAEDRAAIGEFLQAQIVQAREADPTGGWQEHLENALDYRQWHTFVVDRWQNGQWRAASGPASGGERALAVSVPLFAAASAHYNSASAHAPRLILLDEAFAGVDDDSRAKSLGLLATFDLDVVMTSEREWGCYPEVPGLAIAQLSRQEGVDGVGVTRWRWDGRRRSRDAEVGAAALAGARDAAAPDASDDATLFG